MVFRAVSLPVKLADKDAPADIGRFLNCRLPLAPPDYGKTCACLFRDINHTQHLHSSNRVEGRTHRLCGQMLAGIVHCKWNLPLGERTYHLWWYICAHPVNGVIALPRLFSSVALVIPYRSRFYFRHWGEWIVGEWFSAFRFFSFCFFFSLATRCFACSNACNAFSKFLLASFLSERTSNISGTK